MTPGLKAVRERMTLEQKVKLLTGRDFWNTWPVEEVSLRNILMSDGPSGVRGEFWDERDVSLNLPSASAVSSTWDTELLKKVGEVLAEEATRKGVDVVLGPTINLHRSPLGGRHFECFSEDPLLSAKLATSYVQGVQSKGVAACPKHYVANDFETNRFTANVNVDEKTLREVYMRPFEDVVTKGKTWTIMSAYNSVNGTTMSESDLLASPLKDEWEFDGVVISDWTAVRSIAAAQAEQDLAMPGPDGPWGDNLLQAVREGSVSEEAIDRKIDRILLLAERVGALGVEKTPAPKPREDKTISQEHKDFSRRLAAHGTVMLKNELLPLDTSRFKKVLLAGHNASAARSQGGGSATVVPDEVVSPLDALKEIFGDRLDYAQGVTVQKDVEPFPLAQIMDPVTNKPGVHTEMFDADGNSIFQESRESSRIAWIGSSAPLPIAEKLQLRTVFTPSESFVGLLGFSSTLRSKISVNGIEVLDAKGTPEYLDEFTDLMDPPVSSVAYEFYAQESYAIEVEVDLTGREGLSIGALLYTFGLAPDFSNEEKLLDEAVEKAKDSDLAIVVVGTNSKVESEGFDRKNLALPGNQDALVGRIAEVCENVIVVVNSGSPVLLPWRDKVSAILVPYFAGQEMGHALADVLTGKSEPGGRLPTTWPKSEEDVPVLNCTPDENLQVFYEEGIHIGYKAWLRAGKEPAYPFGYGLGFTTWELGEVETEVGTEFVKVSVELKNTGNRSGSQVIQVYASKPDSPVERPEKWLIGFAKVTLDAGAKDAIQIDIPLREFAHWEQGWSMESGEYQIQVGFDSNTALATKIISL